MWFGAVAVRFRALHTDGWDGISVMESRGARGASPPLHVHHTEDELFCVLEGDLRLRDDGRDLWLGAGDTHLIRKGVPHTYRIESEEAVWLTVTTHGDFERFVLDFARPAEQPGLPDRSRPPTPERREEVVASAAAHGIEFVGPPLSS